MATVGAFRVPTNNKDLPGRRVNLLDLLDHCTVNRVFKYHDITGLKRTQNEGDGRNDKVISFVIFGCQAAASYFDKL